MPPIKSTDSEKIRHPVITYPLTTRLLRQTQAAEPPPPLSTTIPVIYPFISPETFEQRVCGDYLLSLTKRRREKALIDRNTAETCLQILLSPKNSTIRSATFRHWAKAQFRVARKVLDNGQLKAFLVDAKTGKLVSTKEEMYDRLCHCHALINHGGRDKTFKAISHVYSRIPLALVERFVTACSICQKNRHRSLNSEKRGNAEETDIELPPTFKYRKPMECLQIAIISNWKPLPLSSDEDSTIHPKQYTCILHVRCVVTNFQFAYPLYSQRDTVEVARSLCHNIFAQFALPISIRSPEPAEYLHSVVRDASDLWPGLAINDIESEVHDPEMQRANEILIQRLARWIDSNENDDIQDCLAKSLPLVIYSLNTQIDGFTGKSPYENMFGRTPRVPDIELSFVTGMNERIINLAIEDPVETDSDQSSDETLESQSRVATSDESDANGEGEEDKSDPELL